MLLWQPTFTQLAVDLGLRKGAAELRSCEEKGAPLASASATRSLFGSAWSRAWLVIVGAVLSLGQDVAVRADLCWLNYVELPNTFGSKFE